MARPIFVVHDQETIENYRRLERILRELYQVLGELLAYGAPVVPAASLPHTQPPPPPPPPPPGTQRANSLHVTFIFASLILSRLKKSMQVFCIILCNFSKESTF